MAFGLLLALPGCSELLSAATASAAGIAGAGIANAVTKNAAVATGIGLGVAAGANAALHYAQRRAHTYEQDQIASAAGHLPSGGVARWSVSHDTPVEPDEQGDVAVTKLISGPGFACKEIVFSVETAVKNAPPQREFYTATVCQDGPRWKWATAEPATERWGSLQ